MGDIYLQVIPDTCSEKVRWRTLDLNTLLCDGKRIKKIGMPIFDFSRASSNSTEAQTDNMSMAKIAIIKLMFQTATQSRKLSKWK